MINSDNIGKYCKVISRMSFSQIFYRIMRVYKQKFLYKYFGKAIYPYKVIENRMDLYCRFLRDAEEYLLPFDFEEEHIESVIRNANLTLNNRFSFLNSDPIHLGDQIDFNAEKVSDKLWKYYLHYFEYLIELMEAYLYTREDKYLNGMVKIINQWIDNTKPGDSNSWEAYPISIRLIIWSSVWELLLSISYSDEKFLTKLLASIKQQTNFLFNNLELDLANNHYTANGKALFWMGVTFPIFKESKKWLEKGKEILHKQLKKEVCSDGSQYENSTSYQLLTLLDYLEVLVLAKKNNIPLHDDFKWYIESMAQYVLSITKPDGTLPLLNDSSEGYPMDSKEIMAVAAVIFNRGDFKFVSKGANLSYLLRLLGNNGLIKYNQIKSEIPDINSVHLKDSGYIILRNGWDNQKSYFIFDAGPIGPDHCCGHAHADNLSFELFSNGETIFLDPGTFEYGNGLKRNYYRSTAAHNTVTIENKNQSTFWGAFRVDHIARVKCNNVHFGNVREVITAEHYGYQRLAQKIIHERTIDWNKSDHWIIKDLIKGNANTKTNGFLNFQVGLNCEKIFAEGNRCFLHFKSGVIVEVQFLSDSALRVELLDSFISKEWKREYTSKQIKVYFEDILPLKIETIITIK